MNRSLCTIAMFVLLGAFCFGQSPSLQIVSPGTQSFAVPGQTITITVSADSTVSEIAIVSPLGFSQTTVGPLQFTLTVPAGTPFDQYQVNASGLAADGEDVVSNPITLFVVPPTGAFKIRTEPTVLRFRSPGEIMPLRVIGNLFDGTTAEITHALGTSYFSRDNSVATVDARGVVTAVAPGKTFISVSNFFASTSINVKVAEPPAQNADTIPPVTQVTATPLANASGWNNSDVTLQFAATDNPGGSGVKSITVSSSGAQTGQTTTQGSSAVLKIAAEGTTTVTYFAVDNAGNQEAAKTLTIQLDKTAPTFSGLPAGCSLWPPNGKLVDVATISAADALSGVATFNVSATSSEPADPKAPDIVVSGTGIGPQTVTLRAQRLGTGPGRTYVITATAQDIAGNMGSQNATCVVPHDQGNNP
ncbi:MAG: OmpL47-type beta-barrel domain-containing protein [Actinomycetota bacterium]